MPVSYATVSVKQQCREATILLRTREVKVAAQEDPSFRIGGESVAKPEGAYQC